MSRSFPRKVLSSSSSFAASSSLSGLTQYALNSSTVASIREVRARSLFSPSPYLHKSGRRERTVFHMDSARTPAEILRRAIPPHCLKTRFASLVKFSTSKESCAEGGKRESILLSADTVSCSGTSNITCRPLSISFFIFSSIRVVLPLPDPPSIKFSI